MVVFFRQLLVVQAAVFEQLRVPQSMQIGPLVVILHLDGIAAFIFRAADVHGLVDIADKMGDKF